MLEPARIELPVVHDQAVAVCHRRDEVPCGEGLPELPHVVAEGVLRILGEVVAPDRLDEGVAGDR